MQYASGTGTSLARRYTFDLLRFVPPKVKPQQNRKSYVLFLKTLQIVNAFACNILSKMSNYMH